MKRYVICGNGVAAAGCIEGIRRVDAEGKITVVSAEPHAVYCRPLISYYLEGKTDPARMNYRAPDFYEKMGCEVRYGKKAAALDAKKKTVTLDDGAVLEYDELCIATGSRPFVPPFAGLDSVEKKFSFMTLDDALALEAALTPDSRVLIVGAGLIGLKCAEGLHGRVASITVCDLANRVLSSILDDACAGIMQRHLEENGIRFLLGDSAERFEQNAALMKSGARVEFDVLVLAVGVRANTELLAQAGGKVERGIVIDETCRTSIGHVFAAGDCTQAMDVSLGQTRVMAIAPNAYLQGECAGVNMAGGEAKFDNAIAMNSIGFFGLHAMTAGSYFSAEDGGELFEQRTERSVRRLFTRGGVLTGFILIGPTERAGIYTSLIRERTPLDTINFELLKQTATSVAFPEAVRRKKFGGAVS